MPLVSQLLRALDFDPQRFLPWRVGNETVGWVTTDFARTLRAYPDVFRAAGRGLELIPAVPETRSAALDRVARALHAQGVVTGWRNERYTVASSAGKAPLFELERGAMRHFGLLARATHLSGIVRVGGTVRMWIARRSTAKPIDPGQLDNLVGGGIASGSDARQTLIKECWEEAGIAPALALQAIYAGRLRICRSVDNGLHHESVIVYDLELPADFVPRNHDDEVSEFMLLCIEELMARLAAGEFTVDAGAVVIDWLARHALAADKPELPALLARLRESGPE